MAHDPSTSHRPSLLLLLQFWDDQVEALEVGDLPHMQDSVTVVGFPQVRAARGVREGKGGERGPTQMDWKAPGAFGKQ
jgi:hypothetical protein